MVVDSTASYVLRGKTGWPVDGERNNGWFIGFAERGDQILTVQAKLEDGISHTQMPDYQEIIACLSPILNKYPKLTHIGLQYKDGRTEERKGLEAYDVLVSKLALQK